MNFVFIKTLVDYKLTFKKLMSKLVGMEEVPYLLILT